MNFGLAAAAALWTAVLVAWPGVTALRMHSARQLGGRPTWWRCALTLEEPCPAADTATPANHDEEVPAA